MIKVTELFHLILSIWDYSQCCHFSAINLLPKKYRLNNFNLSYISQFYIFLENLFSVCYENFQKASFFKVKFFSKVKKKLRSKKFILKKKSVEKIIYSKSNKISRSKIFEHQKNFKAN